MNCDIYVMALTETWLNADAINHSTIYSIYPTRYLFQHVSCKKTEGGIGILYINNV